MTTELRYLLDTNIVSDIVREPEGRAARRLIEVGLEAVAISLVVACEIRFGLAKSGSAKLTYRLEAVLGELAILPLKPPVDDFYADIRCKLESAGTPIGPNDLFIAAHARALGLTLVTDNVKEFTRVPGLAVENWLAPG